jgi:TolA-binding protein
MNKRIGLVLCAFILLATYVFWVTKTYKPSAFQVSTAEYTPDKVLQSEIPDSPELTPEEKVKVQEEIKQANKEIENTLDIKKKSVEQMRNEVHQILNEIVEEDDTVVISFNMTVKNPLAYETKEN